MTTASSIEYDTPRIYLAGPMAGIRHFNYEAFRDVSSILRKMGYDVANPAEHDVQVGFNPMLWDGTESTTETGFDLEEAMRWDLDKVRKANAVVVLPSPTKDWNSKGLNAELEEAKEHGVPIIRLNDSITQVIQPTLLSRHDSTYWVARSGEPACQHHIPTSFPVPCRACDPTLRTKPFGNQKAFSAGGVISGGVKVVGGFSPYAVYTNALSLASEQALADEAKALAGTSSWDILDVKSGDEITLNGNDVKVFNRFTGETRTTSSTGGQKGVKLARYDLIPPAALKQIAEHYGVGAEKYDDNQWRKGYEWSKSFAAMMRHAQQWWGGEDLDEETGSNHLAAVAWHALALLTFTDEHPDFDDRYKGTTDA